MDGACVCVCVCACVRACVHVCDSVHVCMADYLNLFVGLVAQIVL